MTISQVQLANTFNQFRETTNLVIDEVNKILDGTADLVIDTLQANTINGILSANAFSFYSLNASNITFGTISNARTTGTSGNSASTLVLRDAAGNFSSNVITLTAATGVAPLVVSSNTVVANLNADTVDGKNVGSLSAGAIVYANTSTTMVSSSVGTTGQALISGGANAPTWTDVSSSSTPSSIVLRDSSGNFSANVITANSFSGTATSANTLATARTINGVSFNGSANIVITANTTQSLSVGSFLTGSSFNGSSATTLAVDATDVATPSKVVARDASGSFSANVVTANTFSVNTGVQFGSNVLQTSGTLTTTAVAQNTLATFSSTTYRSAKYFIQAANSSSFHSLELTLVHDGSTVYISQYGEVLTNLPLGIFDASISGGNLSLLVTPSYASTTTFKFLSTLIRL